MIRERRTSLREAVAAGACRHAPGQLLLTRAAGELPLRSMRHRHLRGAIDGSFNQGAPWHCRQTLAEMERAEKNRISHRRPRRALDRLRAFLLENPPWA
eukprot:tig00000157_g9720.t1